MYILHYLLDVGKWASIIGLKFEWFMWRNSVINILMQKNAKLSL
jgi:hypothetical protein